MESDDDSVQFEESDSECPDDDNFLWEKLAITTSISNDPIEVFGGYIYLYMQSEDDELFDKMMDQISNAIYKPIAIEHAIDENYDTIVEYINDKNHGFWYEIGKEGKKWKCEWFSGNECDCTDCKGLSVRDVVKGYIKLFLEMQNDELIQKIESDIDEMEDLPLCTRIDHTVTKYADDIEEKLQEARNKLDSNDWDYSCFFS